MCVRAVASVLSLKELPEHAEDASPTLSHSRNGPFYVSSFLISQRDMFESVKRVTKTTDADWTISHDSAEKRWKDGTAAVHQGDFGQFTKMLYSRMFLPTGDGDCQSRRGVDNDVLRLPGDDLDTWTAVAVRMANNHEIPYGH